MGLISFQYSQLKAEQNYDLDFSPVLIEVAKKEILVAEACQSFKQVTLIWEV